MGKGDIKSRKGKIARGSYGVRRQRPSTPGYVAPVKPAAKKVVAKEEAEEKAPVKKAAAKKPAAKKAPAKKKAAAKK